MLLEGDLDLAQVVIDGDDQIDAMLVSLTEKCYDLLVRQSPVASDLGSWFPYFVSSATWSEAATCACVSSNWRRSNRCWPAARGRSASSSEMASVAQDLFRAAIRSWAAQDLRLAHSLENRDDAMDAHYSRSDGRGAWNLRS